MRFVVRIVALSLVALLLFLAGAVLVRSWLQRQHAQIQAEAIETKRTQFNAAVALTLQRADRDSPTYWDAIGRMIDARVRPATAALPPPPAGVIRLIQDLPDKSGAKAAIDFALPRFARLSLLHGRTWGLLLVGSLTLMLIFISLGLVFTRRTGTGDTRTPWSSARAEMSSLEQLARTSVAQGTELAQERDTRRRMERDLSLHQQLQNQALEEKIRLGRDLHDGLIQSLYAVGLTIEAVRPLIARDPAKADQRLGVCLESLNQTIRTVREYITGLSQEKLRQLSFADAVRLFLDELRAGRDVDLELVVDEDAATTLNALQTTEALQVIHEAISNALRHGGATQLTVRLHRGDNEVGLLIKDNGTGFDVENARSGGHGLTNMQARAAGSGATLRIDSAAGQGTRIVLTFPVIDQS